MPRITLGRECPVCGANMGPVEEEMGVCRTCELRGWMVDCTGQVMVADTLEDVELPVEITAPLRAVHLDGPGFMVLVVDHREVLEFTVPSVLVKQCRAMPGDNIRVRWAGSDLGDEVVSLEVV